MRLLLGEAKETSWLITYVLLARGQAGIETLTRPFARSSLRLAAVFAAISPPSRQEE